MFRNHLAATLRHLGRSRWHAALSLLGLSVGLCATLLSALMLRNQTGYDHFIAGHSRVYTVLSVVTPPGRPTIHMPNSSSFLGPRLVLRFPELEATTRLALQPAMLGRDPATTVREQIYWADANAFEVLPMPVVAGDPRAALARPDSVVLTRSQAQRFFGTDEPLGETLLVDGHPMSVGAVLEDFPANGTHLRSGIFAPAIAPWSWLREQDDNPAVVPGSPIGFGTNTYLRLAAGASPERLQSAMPGLTAEMFSAPPPGWSAALQLVRLDRLNTHPGLNPGIGAKLVAIALMGIVILAIAVVNFVNLVTARVAARSVEVAMRKVSGAPRGVLVLQFLGEALLYVGLSALLAVALAEWLLPHMNAFLDTGARFAYWHDPPLLAAMLLAIPVLALVVGAWPAFVLTSARPLAAMQGRRGGERGGERVRQGLVTLQFALLIALFISAGVVEAQRRFATREALRLDTDQVLVIRSRCTQALVDALRRIPGVQALACSSGGMLNEASFMTARDRQGIEQFMFYVPVQPEVFALYGVRPLAGQLSQGAGAARPGYVINETAARRLGFANPGEAVGFALPALGRGAGETLEVIGVVPDFALTSVRSRIEATGFISAAQDTDFSMISLKLSGGDIPETLASIDRAWNETATGTPINRYFVSEYLQRLYLSMERQAQAFGLFSLVAMVLCTLGLLALSAAVAERRTREIGIRKALGADTGHVTRLLLWQLARPVLWANLIAWPFAAWLMLRWLEGYAYRIALPLWLFPVAAGASFLLALLTVAAHCLRASRAHPVAALRYE